MLRSRGQLATAYAPGALFTYEGGLGACMSVSVKNEPVDVGGTTERMIYEQIAEFIDNWRTRASQAENLRHDVDIRQCLDPSLVVNGEQQLGLDRFTFTDATRMGYVPFPLAFACTRCGLHRDCRDVNRAAEQAARFRDACPEPGGAASCADDWEQLDVVMAHWSGGVEALTPMRRIWDNVNHVVTLYACSTCAERRFRLRRPSGAFSDWYFECVSCRTYREILLRDEATLRLLGPLLDPQVATALPVEVNMEPVSYRASATYYPQSDRLLLFRDSDWLDKLRRGSERELARFLGQYLNFPGGDVDNVERERLLRAAGRGAEWDEYVGARGLLTALRAQGMAEADLSPMIAVMGRLDALWEREVFTNRERGSSLLTERVAERLGYARRYDPIRMTVEHRTLEQGTLHSDREYQGKPVRVDVNQHDPHLVPDGLSETDKARMYDRVQDLLRRAGIAKMRLIRALDVCEYTFGYTRTHPLPLIHRDKGGGDVSMPVRLNLFDKIGNPPRHPVLCMRQENEAFYVRLDEAAVRRWLEVNGMPVDLGPDPMRLGGWLIESFNGASFRGFLDDFRAERRLPREPYPYVYTLLHTMAHQLIGVVSELSGLDLGSFSEHLFVPNLAFLIYRRGTTMDLGNLSSMWRNYGDPNTGNLALLKLVQRETLRCGSETLCMMRGGACPDCVLIPETSCLTRNELLSRSVLIGGGVPKWDIDQSWLRGFYEVAQPA